MVLLLLVVVDGCGSTNGGSAPVAASSTTSAPTTTVDSFAGFDRHQIIVSGAPWTVAVADSPALRSQGLMGVTDLGDLDGMLFVFDDDTDAGFWMKDTLLPLDVAFFAADGTLVDLLTMTPCSDDPCPTYNPSGQYRYALEAASGAFAAMDRPSLGFTDG